jgi:hypothetical protein
MKRIATACAESTPRRFTKEEVSALNVKQRHRQTSADRA